MTDKTMRRIPYGNGWLYSPDLGKFKKRKTKTEKITKTLLKVIIFALILPLIPLIYYINED